MSGISHNSFDGTGRLKISNSTSTHLSLGYTGSSQLDFDLPTNYGSSGQGLITDGTGGLSWGVVGGGTSGTSGTSGQSFAPAYFSSWSQKTQTKAAGAETYVHFTDNIETQWGFNSAASATQSWISVVSGGYYQFHYMVSLGHESVADNQAVFFLKKNGVTWSGTGIAFAARSVQDHGSLDTLPYFQITGSWQAQLNASDKIEIFLYSASDLTIKGSQSIPSGKMSAYKLEN